MHEAFLRQVTELALENVSSGLGGPFASLIVKDGNIIAAERNRVTNNLDPTAHAEILAIRSACLTLQNFQLKGCTLYSNCEPCPMCLGAIYWARLDAVFYASDSHDAAGAGFDDRYIYEEILLPHDKRHIPMQKISVADATLAFTEWKQKSDKLLY